MGAIWRFVQYFLYLCTALVSFAYFSQGQLGHTIWPTLTMAKIIEIPFLQRFEYILISMWLLVVLPTIAVSVWCTIRGFSKTFNKPPTLFLILVLIALLGFLFSLMIEKPSISLIHDYP